MRKILRTAFALLVLLLALGQPAPPASAQLWTNRDNPIWMRHTGGPVRVTLISVTDATANGQGSAVEVGWYKDALLTANVTSCTGCGGGNSLAIAPKTSDDGGTTWYSLPGGSAWNNISGTGTQTPTTHTTFGDTWRIEYTITGSATVSFTVKAIFKY